MCEKTSVACKNIRNQKASTSCFQLKETWSDFDRFIHSAYNSLKIFFTSCNSLVTYSIYRFHLSCILTLSYFMWRYIQLLRGRLSDERVTENATMSKVIVGNGGFTVDWSARYVIAREGNRTNTCIHAFSFLLAKHRAPQSSSAKLLLPIIPINPIIPVLCCMLWGNLCRNSCIGIEPKVLSVNCSLEFPCKPAKYLPSYKPLRI